jgi:hypothetical protein
VTIPNSNTQGDLLRKRSVSGRCSRPSSINKHYNTPSWKKGAGVAFEFGNIADARWKRAESRVAISRASGMHLAGAGEYTSTECAGNLVEPGKMVKDA